MSLAAAAKAASDPAGIALVDDSTICDWATLDRLLNQGTNRLLAEGLRPGARVAVFAHNALETALAYLSCLHAGGFQRAGQLSSDGRGARLHLDR